MTPKEMPADTRTSISGTDRREELRKLIVDTARNILDGGRLHDAIAELNATTRFPQINIWSDSDLGLGGAGIAVMCSALTNTMDLKIDLVRDAHRYLLRGASELNRSPTRLGLFRGITGYGAAVALSSQHRDYSQLLDSLDCVVLPAIERETAMIVANPSRAAQLSRHDLMSGLAGWGVYLSLREDAAKTASTMEGVARAAKSILDADPPFHNMRIGTSLLKPEQKKLAPHGFVDCGLSHGGTGLLGMLAILVREGQVAESRDICRLLTLGGTWLSHFVIQSADGPIWPRYLLLDENGFIASQGPSNPPSWCYGSPGISRTLWLVGRALDRNDFCDLSLEAMRTALRSQNVSRLSSPTLCHGFSGLLLVALLFASDTGDSEITSKCSGLVDRIVNFWDSNSVLGFRDHETGGGWVENPGLLNGAAGVVMVLAAVLGEGVVPSWTRLLAMA
jgi:hypothetical protein